MFAFIIYTVIKTVEDIGFNLSSLPEVINLNDKLLLTDDQNQLSLSSRGVNFFDDLTIIYAKSFQQLNMSDLKTSILNLNPNDFILI